MARIQLALNVSDLEAAAAFYASVFGVPPAKRFPGYANFAIGDPPLKLVLIEDTAARARGEGGALNHLGIEVCSADEVREVTRRLQAAHLSPKVVGTTTCCYAVQDKVWVHDPDGAPWEVYVVLADAVEESGLHGDGQCCGSDAASITAAACC